MANPLAAGRRALGLVEAIGHSAHDMSFSDLAERKGLSGASLTRLLKMLVEEDWIRQERPNGRYSVGYRTLRLAHALRSFGLHSPLVQGVITSLAHNTGHSACIAVFQGDFFMLAVKFEMRNSYHYIDVFAPNTDWIDNGMGQFLLSFQPRDVVSRIYRRNFDIAVPDEHWRRFETIRRQKQFVSNEGVVTRVMAGVELAEGAPITNVVAVAALNSETIEVEKVLAHVQHAAVEATRRLAALHDAPNELVPV
jgi:DNA-binding IclR family transcriptional regulator